MPASSIQHQNGMRFGRHGAGDLRQHQVHRRRVGFRQHRGHADVARGADRAERMRAGEALLAPAARPLALGVPHLRHAAFLADSGLVLEPRLDPRGPGMLACDLADHAGHAFSKRACAFGSASGRSTAAPSRAAPFAGTGRGR
jgi:hypothetical protein